MGRLLGFDGLRQSFSLRSVRSMYRGGGLKLLSVLSAADLVVG